MSPNIKPKDHFRKIVCLLTKLNSWQNFCISFESSYNLYDVIAISLHHIFVDEFFSCYHPHFHLSLWFSCFQCNNSQRFHSHASVVIERTLLHQNSSQWNIWIYFSKDRNYFHWNFRIRANVPRPILAVLWCYIIPDTTKATILKFYMFLLFRLIFRIRKKNYIRNFHWYNVMEHARLNLWCGYVNKHRF